MTQEKNTVVLASASPRRQELIKQVWQGELVVAPQDIDETPLKDELPKNYVQRVTTEKAQAAQRQYPKNVIIASDTIVAVGRRILQKAKNRSAAEKQITLLSGRRHRVLTGVALWRPGALKPHYRLAEVRVQVARLHDRHIQAFLDSGDWQGVAVYRMQGVFGKFIKSIHGQPSAVLGLPLYDSSRMLESVAGVWG